MQTLEGGRGPEATQGRGGTQQAPGYPSSPLPEKYKGSQGLYPPLGSISSSGPTIFFRILTLKNEDLSPFYLSQGGGGGASGASKPSLRMCPSLPMLLSCLNTFFKVGHPPQKKRGGEGKEKKGSGEGQIISID
jgi:hypothetical protein